MSDGATRLRYVATSVALGLVLGWLPGFAHGPIAAKWDVHGVDGEWVVWAYRAARLSIGMWVGVVAVPAAWALRGPLCGMLVMMPLGMVGLSNEYCGPPCMFWNMATGAAVGFAVGGLAWSLTGMSSVMDAR
jgi:hypothetical protein